MSRILVVDDDKPIRNLVATVLQRRGLSIDAAPDGVTALQLMAQNDYAVAIVDLMMPGMNGIELLDRVRRPNGTRRPSSCSPLPAPGTSASSMPPRCMP